MADAIPTPQDQKPAEARSTVVVEQPMSQWRALKEAGWWAGYDSTMLTLIGLLWLTALYWKIFGHPTASSIIILLLVNISVMLAWLIWAVFRCALFVLRLHAEMAMMPENSARIAAAFLSGKKT
jgi:hypothetical protein